MNVTSRSVLAVFVALGVFACGGKEGATPDKSGSPKSGGSAKATAPDKSGAPGSGSAASKPAPAGNKATVAVPKYKTREVKPAELGGQKLKATVCAFDTKIPVPMSDSFSNAVMGFAIGPDDTIWIVDAEGKVRHYVNQAPDGCELALDDKFGTGGVLAIADTKAEERIAVDKNGVVYVNTGNGPMKIVSGKAEKIDCSRSGRVSAGRESDAVFIGEYPLKDGKCADKLELKEWGDSPFLEILGVEKDGIDVKGTFKKGDKNVGQAGFHDFTGARKIAVGKEDGDEDIYYTHDVFGCALGLCVVDGNASSLRVWKKDGAFVGKVNVDDISGVETFPKHGDFAAGAMWISGSGDAIEKGKDEKGQDDDRYLPVIVKVTTGG